MKKKKNVFVPKLNKWWQNVEVGKHLLPGYHGSDYCLYIDAGGNMMHRARLGTQSLARKDGRFIMSPERLPSHRRRLHVPDRVFYRFDGLAFPIKGPLSQDEANLSSPEKVWVNIEEK